MIYRVVISHGQSEFISKFLKGSVFVFDSPSENDILRSVAAGNVHITVPVAGNRGANRNAGLDYIVQHFHPDANDIVEFYDGDRFPVVYNSDHVITLLQKDIDVLLFCCEQDERISRIAIPVSGPMVVDSGTICNPFYSCGFAMRYSAIEKVLEYNGNKLFEERFFRWGCEDQFLGVVCDHLGLRVAITRDVILNGQVGGDSHEHDDYRAALQMYIDTIIERGLPLRGVSRKL